MERKKIAQGLGRPKMRDAKIPVCIKLRPNIIEFLKTVSNRAEYIAMCIRERKEFAEWTKQVADCSQKSE